jgi:hypothetical protein
VRSVGTGAVPLMQIGLLSVLSVVVLIICMHVYRRVTV